MRLVHPASPRQIDLGLLVLRVVTGVVFAVHGAQKLFVFGFDGVTGAFGKMGIPLPGITGPLVALVEFFGGLALIAGLLTRLASFGLAVNMLGALFMVHLAAGFFAPSGYEFVLTLASVAITLVITGAGRYSADALLARRTQHAADDARPLRRAA
jgi:putative oxidoreductase